MSFKDLPPNLIEAVKKVMKQKIITNIDTKPKAMEGQSDPTVSEEKGPCWTGYKRKKGTKAFTKGSCVKEEEQLDEITRRGMEAWGDSDKPGQKSMLSFDVNKIQDAGKPALQMAAKLEGNSKIGKAAKEELERREKESKKKIDEATKREKSVMAFFADRPEVGQQILAFGKKQRETENAFKSGKKEIERLRKKEIKEEQLDEASLMDKLKDAVPSAKTVSRNKQGEHVFRKGFFYSGGATSDHFADKVSKELTDAGIEHTVTGHDMIDKPFKGGAGVAQNSHFMVRVKIHGKPKEIKEDNEHEMARNQLRTAKAGIEKLMKNVKGEGNLEAWVQSKITKASDYIDTVSDYLNSQDPKNKKVKVNEAFSSKIYNRNEDHNRHSENVAYLAKHFGDKKDHAEAVKIMKDHEEAGELTPELKKRRDALHDKFWPKAKEYFKKETKINEATEKPILKRKPLAKTVKDVVKKKEEPKEEKNGLDLLNTNAGKIHRAKFKQLVSGLKNPDLRQKMSLEVSKANSLEKISDILVGYHKHVQDELKEDLLNELDIETLKNIKSKAGMNYLKIGHGDKEGSQEEFEKSMKVHDEADKRIKKKELEKSLTPYKSKQTQKENVDLYAKFISNQVKENQINEFAPVVAAEVGANLLGGLLAKRAAQAAATRAVSGVVTTAPAMIDKVTGLFKKPTSPSTTPKTKAAPTKPKAKITTSLGSDVDPQALTSPAERMDPNLIKGVGTQVPELKDKDTTKTKGGKDSPVKFNPAQDSDSDALRHLNAAVQPYDPYGIDAVYAKPRR